VDGRIIVRDGRLQTLDEAPLIARHAAIARAMLGSA
jgi:hypothetical protein